VGYKNNNRDNAMNTTEQPADNGTIKFTHAEDGRIAFNTGLTVFGDLLTIGAFTSAKILKHNPEHVWYEYPTDIKGLESLMNKNTEVIGTIAGSITSLSMMLAYVDLKEVGDCHINNHAWLMAGLGELLAQLSLENHEMRSSLKMLKEVQS
jgi:hypothetical protein